MKNEPIQGLERQHLIDPIDASAGVPTKRTFLAASRLRCLAFDVFGVSALISWVMPSHSRSGGVPKGWACQPPARRVAARVNTNDSEHIASLGRSNASVVRCMPPCHSLCFIESNVGVNVEPKGLSQVAPARAAVSRCRSNTESFPSARLSRPSAVMDPIQQHISWRWNRESMKHGVADWEGRVTTAQP